MLFLKSCLLGRQGSARGVPPDQREPAAGGWCAHHVVDSAEYALQFPPSPAVHCLRNGSRASFPPLGFFGPRTEALLGRFDTQQRRLNDSTIAGLLVVNLPFAVDSGRWLSGFAQLPRKQPRSYLYPHTRAHRSACFARLTIRRGITCSPVCV